MTVFKTHRKLKIATIVLLSFLFLVSVIKLAQNPVAQPLATQTQASETISTVAIYNDVNAARHGAGAQILSLNPLETQAAEEKCQDMVTNDYYAHASPITGDLGYVYAQHLITNGTWFNENLDEGNLTTNQAWVSNWLSSPGHKATMLDPRFTDTGLAICHRPSSQAGYITIVEEFVAIPASQTAAQATPTQTKTVCKSYPAVETVPAMTICN